MLASELFNAIEEIVPLHLALKNDKVGYFGPENHEKMEINKVQLRMDVLPEHNPYKSGFDLVICHHPPLFEPDFPVYVIHSNWDVVDGGANDALAECLKLKVLDIFDKKTGIGRICSTFISTRGFIDTISNSIPTDHINIINYVQKIIKKVAVVSGFGLSNHEYITLAHEKDVDVYLSGDLNHQSALIAKKLGICVIDATHHATEIPGLMKLCDLISKLGVKTVLIDDGVPWENIKF